MLHFSAFRCVKSNRLLHFSAVQYVKSNGSCIFQLFSSLKVTVTHFWASWSVKFILGHRKVAVITAIWQPCYIRIFAFGLMYWGVAYLCRFRLSDLLSVPGSCYGMWIKHFSDFLCSILSTEFHTPLKPPLPPTFPSPRGPPSNHREEFLKPTNGPCCRDDVGGWRHFPGRESTWGRSGGGGSTPRDTCRASLKLAPKRRPKFPVPLCIPYFFME